MLPHTVTHTHTHTQTIPDLWFRFPLSMNWLASTTHSLNSVCVMNLPPTPWDGRIDWASDKIPPVAHSQSSYVWLPPSVTLDHDRIMRWDKRKKELLLYSIVLLPLNLSETLCRQARVCLLPIGMLQLIHVGWCHGSLIGSISPHTVRCCNFLI